MSNRDDKSPLEQFADVLLRHGVEFIVIGGQAEALFGSPRVTYDVDLCYRKTAQNLQRLAAALKELRVTLRNAPTDLPFQIDAESLALGDNFTFNTKFDELDLLGYVEPIGGYEELATTAVALRVGDHELNVISLEDLITIKQHINRPKDQESLYQLLTIREERAKMQPPSTG